MTPNQTLDAIHTLKAIVGKSPIMKISGIALGATSVAYTSGYVIGSVVTLNDFSRGNNGTGIIQSIIIQDLSKQSAALDVIFFDALPTGTYTNNTECDIADADITKIIAIKNIVAADYVSFKDNSAACLSGLAIPYQTTVDSNKIYVLFVTRGTPTYVANELSCAIGVLQDA